MPACDIEALRKKAPEAAYAASGAFNERRSYLTAPDNRPSGFHHTRRGHRR